MRSQYLLTAFHTAEHEFIRQVAPQATKCTLRWNGTSTAHLTLKDSDAVIPELLADGMRGRVMLVTADDETGAIATRKLVDGRVGTMTGDEAPAGTVTVPVVDDFDEFSTVLGWQVPGAGIGGQGAAEYARYSGPSETAVKAAIAANVARLGKPWDVAPSLGRGSTGPLELRMHALAEKILDRLILDRLQLTIDRDVETNRWTIDIIEGETFPRPLTPQSGVLASWSWVKQPPTATRVVVGGRGEGIAREFALVVDSALEAELGTILEIFADARNVDEGDPLEPYGMAELAKHRGAAGFMAELRETTWFRFPEAYDLGTRVNVQVGALQVDDVITEIEITHDAENGLRAAPRVGLASADPQKRLIGYVQDVAAAVRGLQRR